MTARFGGNKYDWMTIVMSNARLSQIAHRVAWHMCNSFNKEFGYAFRSVSQIAKLLNCSPRHALRGVLELEKEGYVDVARSEGDRNHYVLTVPAGVDVDSVLALLNRARTKKQRTRHPSDKHVTATRAIDVTGTRAIDVMGTSDRNEASILASHCNGERTPSDTLGETLQKTLQKTLEDSGRGPVDPPAKKKRSKGILVDLDTAYENCRTLQQLSDTTQRFKPVIKVCDLMTIREANRIRLRHDQRIVALGGAREQNGYVTPRQDARTN